MEQAPVFGQIYVHVEKIGWNDNIGVRKPPQSLRGIDVQDDGALGSTLNNRATGTDAEKAIVRTSNEQVREDSLLDRADDSKHPGTSSLEVIEASKEEQS